jgi:NDP-sugar pyrophosphorylase family protein
MLQEQGVERVVLCLGHLGEQIQELIGDGHAVGLCVRYSLDGARPLGTGGALSQALPLLGKEFFALYGDAFPSVSMAQLLASYRSARCRAMMSVAPNANRWDRSNVSLRDGRLLAYCKRSPQPGMEHIDAGLSLLSSAVFADRPRGVAFDLADVFEDLSTRGQLAAFEFADRIYEIGSVQGVHDAEQFLSRRR